MGAAGEQIGLRLQFAVVRHMEQVDAGHHLEQLAGNMGEVAGAVRGHVDLARIGLGISDELGDGLRRERRRHHHDERRRADIADRRDIADEVEVEIVVQQVAERVRRRDLEQRVAVRRRADHGLGRQIGAGAGLVLGDKLLAEAIRQRLRDQARGNVGRTARRVADDEAHRPRRIIQRRRGARQNRHGGSARCQLQNATAVQFHGGSPRCGWTFVWFGLAGW